MPLGTKFGPMAPHISDLSQHTPSICRRKPVPRVVLRLKDWEALSIHAIDSYPNESVGILCGHLDNPTRGYHRLVNLHSGRAFEVCPESLSSVLAAIEGAGSMPLLLCHSHPDGDAMLSRGDLKGLRYWPALTGVVAVSKDSVLDFRVFSIETELLVQNIPIRFGEELMK
jgi:proteasome lid subunit RPN8/RPN11